MWILGAPHRLVNLAHGVGQWLLGQAVLIGGAGYRDGEGGRDGLQVGNWWQQGRACAGRVGGCGNGVRGGRDHVVGDSLGADDATARPSPGKTSALLAWAMV